MSPRPILLIGGSGVIGRWTARFLRDAHPDVPLLIGGRDLAKPRESAAEISCAEGVALDLTAEDLGLGVRAISAVAIFLKDDTVAGLRFAQARGVPHISISSGIHEIGPEVASYIHQHRALRRKFGVTPRIHRRGRPSGSGPGKRRWRVERTLAWLLENRRLALRYDRRGFIVQSLLQAACLFLVAERLANEF